MDSRKSLSELKILIEGSYICNCDDPDNLFLDCVVPLESTKENSISFVRTVNFVEAAKSSSVSALIINPALEKHFSRPLLVAENVEVALSIVLDFMYPPKRPNGEISKNVSIDQAVTLGKNCEIGDFVSISENTVIGDNCIIGSNVTIGENVVIGEDSVIGAGNVINDDTVIGKRFISFGNCTIGADGFRFVFTPEGHKKIPQVGKVVIGDDVEIGANCTIDRGGLDDTIIGDGCKFDNMVHIAHNCILEKNIVIAGQSGMAGSTKVGNNVMISGHVALQDHIEVGDGVILAGKTSVRKSIKEPGIYAGEYALPLTSLNRLRTNIKELVNFNRWARRLEKIEKKLGLQD